MRNHLSMTDEYGEPQAAARMAGDFAERRGGSDRREIEDLQRKLAAAEHEAREQKLNSKLADIESRLAQTALKAAEAAEDAVAAGDAADQALANNSAHERECVIRYEGIHSALEPLKGLPQAVVDLAQRVANAGSTREQQHSDNQARFTKQDSALETQTKALNEIRELVNGTIGKGKSRVIALQWALMTSMFGAIVYLIAAYVLPAP